MQTRRTLITALAVSASAAALLAACGKIGGSSMKGDATAGLSPDEATLGDPKAPIKMVEYASVACPVCAKFNNEVFESFKKKYIDTGRVFYISREINAHNPALSTAGFLLARCAGQDKYFQVTNAIYHAQEEMEKNGEVKPTLLKIAKDAGLNEKQFDACVGDPVAIEAQNARVEKFARQDNISSTPTFMLNGQIVAEGFVDLPRLDELIAAAEAKAKAAPAAAAPAPAAPAPAPAPAK